MTLLMRLFLNRAPNWMLNVLYAVMTPSMAAWMGEHIYVVAVKPAALPKKSVSLARPRLDRPRVRTLQLTSSGI